MSFVSGLKDLYHERTNYQFMSRKWRWALLSGIVIGAGVLGFALRGGLNLGIDFEGGTSWDFTAKSGQSVSTSDVRNIMKGFGLGDAKVIITNGDGARVQTKTLTRDESDKVTNALAKYGNITRQDVSVSDVGPTWGKQVSQKALRALIVFFIVIAAYLSLRFEWKMAASAIIAVVHDILVTVGVYAITGFEVTPATVIAFLTILGFSLYDTVVVFDKIKENEPTLGTAKGMTYSAMVNRSMNQVLARSLNTSFVALLPVTSLLVVGSWIMGALSLRDFGLALFVGLLTGAYSSIFVATPILAAWREREPKMRALRERAEAQAARGGSESRAFAADPDPDAVGPFTDPQPVGAGAAAVSGGPPASTAGVAPVPPGSAVPAPEVTARPRQQRRRKRR